MTDWAGWGLGIAGLLLVAGIVAGWKLVANKADKSEVRGLRESLESDNKEIHARIDRSLLVIAQQSPRPT